MVPGIAPSVSETGVEGRCFTNVQAKILFIYFFPPLFGALYVWLCAKSCTCSGVVTMSTNACILEEGYRTEDMQWDSPCFAHAFADQSAHTRMDSWTGNDTAAAKAGG